MSSVSVLTKKNLSVLWEKKSKCPKKKFSKCGEGEKNVSVEFSGVRKKNGNWKKSSEKKIKVFLDEN